MAYLGQGVGDLLCSAPGDARNVGLWHEAPPAIGQSNVRSARILQTSTCFAPISFPLFQGVRFGGGRIEFSSSMVILLELSEDGMVRRMPDPLNYGSFRGVVQT
jgi:hypothetical protein